MRNKLIIGSVLILLVGFLACQKSERLFNAPSLETNLYTAVGEIIGTQVSAATNENEQGVSVEKFDGSGPSYIMNGMSGQGVGNFGIPGFGPDGIGRIKFGIPHIDSCAVVTVSSETYPKEITIVYSGACSSHGHHVKNGTIIITLSDSLTAEGAIQTINYEDFYIDSMKVELTAMVQNLGKNDDGHWLIEKTYEQTLTRDDISCIRENKETQEWISGFETATRSDNLYYLTGEGSVSINDTATYSKVITTPLVFDAGCDYITSGVVGLSKNGSTAVIDYGDGTCDNIATVTIDGVTEEINLHSHKFHKDGQFDKHFEGFGNKHKEGEGH